MTKSMGFHQVSNALSTAKTLAQLIAPGELPAVKNLQVFLSCETQAIRYRCDDGTPTASIGHKLDAGQSIWLSCDLSKVKLIQVAAGAVLTIEFFRN